MRYQVYATKFDYKLTYEREQQYDIDITKSIRSAGKMIAFLKPNPTEVVKQLQDGKERFSF